MFTKVIVFITHVKISIIFDKKIMWYIQSKSDELKTIQMDKLENKSTPNNKTIVITISKIPGKCGFFIDPLKT